MLTFCWNRSSWDEATDTPIVGSMCDRIISPITRHLPAGSWQHSRHPIPGAINLYSSARSAFGETVTDAASVLISHGIADKGIRTKIHADFDYTIYPSAMLAATSRQRGATQEQTPILGYTKLDPLLNGEVEPLPRDDRVRVLYAPTHGGGGEQNHWADLRQPAMSAARRTSWWARDQILNALDPDVFDVVQCHHPRYTEGHQATFRQYVGADVVIADGGSTLWEAMILGIPLVVPAWLTRRAHRRRNTAESYLYERGIGRHATSPRQLASMVRQAAEAGQTRAEANLAEKALAPELRGTSGKAHADWITATLINKTGGPHAEGTQEVRPSLV